MQTFQIGLTKMQMLKIILLRVLVGSSAFATGMVR